MENETEKKLSPLHPGWGERHADECDYILVSPIGVVTHAHDEDELVDDYIRNVKPYLPLQAYRKTNAEAMSKTPGAGPWIGVKGLNFTALRSDVAEEFLEWLPTFSQSDGKLRVYEAIDIRPRVQAVYDERDRRTAEAAKRTAERAKAQVVAKVMRQVRNGSETIEDIQENSYLNTSTVEAIVKELIAQGKLELVDYQPPVQKLIRVKQ